MVMYGKRADFTWAELGQRVRDLRLRLGLSQAQLATKAGLSPAGVHQIEVGGTNPQLGTLEHIAAALGVSLRSLMVGEHESMDTPETEELIRTLRRVMSSGNDVAKNNVRSALLTSDVLMDMPSVYRDAAYGSKEVTEKLTPFEMTAPTKIVLKPVSQRGIKAEARRRTGKGKNRKHPKR